MFVQARQAPQFRTWVDILKSSAPLEDLADWTAPPVVTEDVHPGGTGLLRDMAACNFRAWAIHRLGARSPEDPETGISSLESGSIVHKSLELIWGRLQTHAALCALTPAECAAVVSDSIREALVTAKGLGRKLEQKRLEKLIGDWMKIERSRSPFRVIGREQKTADQPGRT